MTDIAALLSEVRKITGYQSVTDVSKQHPPQYCGRPVVWIEMVAASDAFAVVNNHDHDVAGVAFDGEMSFLWPVSPDDLDGSRSAESLAFFLGYHMSNYIKRIAMSTWEGVA